jgi:hypothetical protein
MWNFFVVFVSDFCHQECALVLFAVESVDSWQVGQAVCESRDALFIICLRSMS